MIEMVCLACVGYRLHYLKSLSNLIRRGRIDFAVASDSSFWLQTLNNQPLLSVRFAWMIQVKCWTDREIFASAYGDIVIRLVAVPKFPFLTRLKFVNGPQKWTALCFFDSPSLPLFAVNMITPAFSVEQNNDSITIKINTPHVRVSHVNT
jgi:hypothetical protein